jgi:hypothetical protein
LIDAIRSAACNIKPNSPLAKEAQETAHKLLMCCNVCPLPVHFSDFANKLVLELISCFTQKKSNKQEREFMWGSFHVYRTSIDFRDCWIKFVQQAVNTRPSPIFYQHITDSVFRALIKVKYGDDTYSSGDAQNVNKANTPAGAPLTRESENALRYTAGYVIRKIRYKLEHITDISKEEMIYCIMDMAGDEWDEERGTEDWTNLIDRGGLWHVNDLTYDFFYAMEQEIQCHFQPVDITKEMSNVISKVLENENVLFYWYLLTSDIKEDDATKLLNMIVELFVNTRGFAFASSCVEQYKQSTHKLIEKGKGIRKEVFTSNLK